MSERQKRLFKLRMKINKGRKANKKATKDEKQRLDDPHWEAKERAKERRANKERWGRLRFGIRFRARMNARVSVVGEGGSAAAEENARSVKDRIFVPVRTEAMDSIIDTSGGLIGLGRDGIAWRR